MIRRIGAPTTANDSRYVNYGPTFQFWVPPRKRRFLKQISGWSHPAENMGTVGISTFVPIYFRQIQILTPFLSEG